MQSLVYWCRYSLNRKSHDKHTWERPTIIGSTHISQSINWHGHCGNVGKKKKRKKSRNSSRKWTAVATRLFEPFSVDRVVRECKRQWSVGGARNVSLGCHLDTCLFNRDWTPKMRPALEQSRSIPGMKDPNWSRNYWGWARQKAGCSIWLPTLLKWIQLGCEKKQRG